eukprot:4861071-Prymnesium_polylepis.2
MSVTWLQHTFTISAGDVVPFKTALVFGISEWEIFWTLLHGGTAAIVPDAVVRNPFAFARVLSTTATTVVFLIPSHLDALLPALEDCSLQLRDIVCCGESLHVGTVRSCYKSTRAWRVHNVYGPTEVRVPSRMLDSSVKN